MSQGGLDQETVARLLAVEDLSAEFSDLLDAEGYRLAIPTGVLPQLIPGSRIVGRALTIRYLPARRADALLRTEDPAGGLGNAALTKQAQPGDVLVVQSAVDGVSVLGSEAAAAFRDAGVIGAVVDGSVRDVEGLVRLPFPTWARGRTPATGRWRLEVAELGGAVTIGGVQVRQGDVVAADSGGIAVVPAELFDTLARRLLDR